MFKLTGILKVFGIGGTTAASIAAFIWTYLGGYSAVEYGWITIKSLLIKATVAAGVAGLASLVVTAVLIIGLIKFKEQLKLGKKKFTAW